MTTYAELKKEVEKLNRKLAVAFANERQQTVNEIIIAMREYKIDSSDLGHNLKSPPKWVNAKTGETWTGRGRHPLWLSTEDAIDCNKA